MYQPTLVDEVAKWFSTGLFAIDRHLEEIDCFLLDISSPVALKIIKQK
jgi:hypothetical protein